jgi:hypothetical protein
MKLKKILIYIIFIYLFYILYKKVIDSNTIEQNVNFVESFKPETDFMYYSNECKKKSQKDPNLHDYSIYYIDNAYSNKNENNLLNKYYKSLGDALGNIDKIKDINNIKNADTEKKMKNSSLSQNTKIPEYSTCNIPKKKIIVIRNSNTIQKYSEEENKILTIEFQKIISLNVDINTDNPQDSKNNDYYHEYSNDYFNNIFRTISLNNYKPLINFIDRTNQMTEILYTKYLSVEDFIINLINNIEGLKIETNAKFKVMQRFIKSYLYSDETDCSYIEFDILIYRDGKNNGKHINIIASLEKTEIELISILVVGLVIESDINTIVIPYDIIKDKEMIIDGEDNNEEEYSLIKMSDLEINKYIGEHENQLSTRIS